MLIPRRDFLKMLGVAAGAGAVDGCGRFWAVPDRLVQGALRGPGLESHRQSLCGLCESGCGVTVRLVDGMPVGLKGNVNHPLNSGGLCPVGQAGLEVLYAPQRLDRPLRRTGSGEFQTVGWDNVLSEIGARLAELKQANRGDRIALITGEPGQLFHQLTERFVGALGSPNLTRVGEPTALAFRLTQGVDAVPGFDFAGTDLVFSFGLDLFEDGPAPLHAIAALVGSRLTDERAALLHVGTRLSPSASKAEQFVNIEPGTHGAFALGVAHVLVREGSYDRRFVEEHTFGFEDFNDRDGQRRIGFRRLLLERYYPDRAAQLCGCAPARIVQVARRFAAASRPLAIAGGEALSGTNATWNGMAVHALNALVGAFDREGGVVLAPPIPLTPLMPIAGAPEPRASALFDGDAIEALAEGVLDGSRPLEMLLVVGANPVYSSPAGDQLRQALAKVPMVVSVSPFQDETAAEANVILPSHVYLERWQATTTTPTVAFSTLGVGQPVIEPLFNSRDPGDILLSLAHQIENIDPEALPWPSYEDYLKHRLEGLVVSGEGAVVTGSFEETWVHFLEERGWRFLEHKSIDGFWKDLLRESGWWNPVRATGDWQRLLPTPSGRFEFFSQYLEQELQRRGREHAVRELPDREALAVGLEASGLAGDVDEICLPHFEPPAGEGEGELALIPFQPITARGALSPVSPMVMEMYGYPNYTEWRTWVELAPVTAHHLHLEDGDEVEVQSHRGAFLAVVRLQPGASPGVAHVPTGLGRSEELGGGGGVGANPVEVLVASHDSLTGDRALASTRVRLRLVRRRSEGGPAPLHGVHG